MTGRLVAAGSAHAASGSPVELRALDELSLPEAVRRRMARLLGVFIAAALYLVAVYHMTNIYFARQGAFEAFILLGRDGGTPHAMLFWVGYVVVGSIVPMLLVFHPRLGRSSDVLWAAALTVLGAFAWLFVFIIGGQAFPLEIFPGHVASSSFADGVVTPYVPSLPEFLLGLGGVGAAFVITMGAARVLDFMPHDDLAGAPAQEAA